MLFGVEPIDDRGINISNRANVMSGMASNEHIVERIWFFYAIETVLMMMVVKIKEVYKFF